MSVGRYLEQTDDAYVRADWIPISARVSGYVAQVLVEDDQPVKAGDVLVRIEDRDYQARLDQASRRTGRDRGRGGCTTGQPAGHRITVLDAYQARPRLHGWSSPPAPEQHSRTPAH